MIDATLPLAFTVHANKGATALLLGSGVSRAAGIPTGWEITLDLVRKLAIAQEGAEPSDPEAWYRTKFNEEPGYDRVLALLAPSAPQRHALVRGYFEPTEDERDQGLKAPTKAHRAIAELVAKGYVRVIITTNFDRLMETALSDAGVPPSVISNADGLKGATPLPHVRCVLLKVHGDYHDNRILNSPDELATYDPAMARYVARIAEDFGLVVAGWSGEYDEALRAALADGRTNAAYPLYWSSRGPLGTKAAQFLHQAKGTEIQVRGADEFFQELMDKVQAMEDMAGSKTMTTAVAVASAKRFLASDAGRIRFHDLVNSETKAAVAALRKSQYVNPNVQMSKDEFRAATRSFEVKTNTLLHLFALGAYWKAQASPFVHSLNAIGHLSSVYSFGSTQPSSATTPPG